MWIFPRWYSPPAQPRAGPGVRAGRGLLYKELSRTDIKVEYMIDQRNDIEADVEIIRPGSQWRRVDAIIISPLEYQSIIDICKDRFTCRILVLKKLLMELGG